MWLLYAVLASILWGLNYSLAEKILTSISSLTLLAFEMLVGALIFFAIGYFFDLKKDWLILVSQPKIFWLTALEIIIILLANFFIVSSIKAKNATAAGMIELIYPLFTIFFTWILFNENHVDWSVVIGGSFIFIGVIVLGL